MPDPEDLPPPADADDLRPRVHVVHQADAIEMPRHLQLQRRQHMQPIPTAAELKVLRNAALDAEIAYLQASDSLTKAASESLAKSNLWHEARAAYNEAFARWDREQVRLKREATCSSNEGEK